MWPLASGVGFAAGRFVELTPHDDAGRALPPEPSSLACIAARVNRPTCVNLEFAIRSWSAWSPGLSTPAQWAAWAAQPWLPEGEAQPELKQMPAMSRRRLNPLGRSAVQVMYDTRAQTDAAVQANAPVVLASRYGDASRSLALLAELVRGEAVSPTAFGLSVHNAIGAMYSITCGDHANYLSVAAGAASAAAGLVEAAALLADGAPEVLLVCYDEPLPGAYATFEDEPSALYAWAWCLTQPVAGQPHWCLACEPAADGPAAPAALPFGLDMLRAVVRNDAHWQRAETGRQWQLSCHASAP